MDFPNKERLVQIIAEEILRVLRQRGLAPCDSPKTPERACASAEETPIAPMPAPASACAPHVRPIGPPGPLFLFTGAVSVDDEVWTALAELARKARVASALLSRSFLDHTRESDVAERLPLAALHTPPLSERQILALADAHLALVIPALSPNTAAKAAAGIHDSESTLLLRMMLQKRKPVLALRDMLEPCSAESPLGLAASTPPAMRQTVNAHRLALERLGVRFIERGELVEAGLAALRPADNGPRVLPPPKPALRREFVTEDDLRALKARGESVRLVGPHTIVTDTAREYAAREGIALE
ncbi:MAG: hypothetical protein NTW86_23125 [Candidatus Sumerlaeota bacterium]|nr:hypothetical protein [Candidatus Sumerlaeota bacterium]